MKSSAIKARVMQWLRYDQQYPLVAMEVQWSPGFRYNLADIIAISKKGKLVEIEVKTSMGDLRGDLHKKEKHECLARTHEAKIPMACDNGVWLKSSKVPSRFYYAVPFSIKEQAAAWIAEKVPYAGLISFPFEDAPYPVARLIAPRLHDYILDQVDQWQLVRDQSATLVRLALKLAKADISIKLPKEQRA